MSHMPFSKGGPVYIYNTYKSFNSSWFIVSRFACRPVINNVYHWTHKNAVRAQRLGGGRKENLGGVFLTLVEFYDQKSCRCAGIVKTVELFSTNGKDKTCRFCGGRYKRNEVDHRRPFRPPKVFIVDRRKSHRQPFSSFFFFPRQLGPACLSATWQIGKLFGIMEFTWTRQSTASPDRGAMFGFCETQTAKWNNPVHT